jgi:hypothetical protein
LVETVAAAEAAAAAVAHSRTPLVPSVKKPAKNETQKIREIDGSYLCLQQFDKF